MEDVRQFETTMSQSQDRVNAFLISKPALFLLAAGGILLGALNFIGMARTLFAPTACL